MFVVIASYVKETLIVLHNFNNNNNHACTLYTVHVIMHALCMCTHTHFINQLNQLKQTWSYITNQLSYIIIMCLLFQTIHTGVFGSVLNVVFT